MSDLETKTCSTCKQDLPLDSFGKKADGRLGRANRCRECSRGPIRERNRKWQAANREKCNVATENWRKRNPDRYRETARKKEQRHRDAGGPWARALKRRYGITAEDYYRMLSEQSGVCAVCKKTPENAGVERLLVDHNHDTGKVRGLLCRECNTGIGMLDDDIRTVFSAFQYLQLTNN